MKKHNRKNTIYPHIIPDIHNWSVNKLYEDRTTFVQEIVEKTKETFFGRFSHKQVGNILQKTIYQEQTRVKEEPWKVDPDDDKEFWKKAQKILLKSSPETSEEAYKQNVELIAGEILFRYADEIAGGFKVKTFKFARKFLTALFKRIFNAVHEGTSIFPWGKKKDLWEKMRVYGPIEKIRKLAEEGTVVLVPTHFSNLDSILIGYCVDSVTGIQALSYGAGLNLYNNGIVARFMNRLGAYRVDRRKKNLLYLETLKVMSELSLERGTFSLFFPGGTRSRSGKLEQNLKLGLLGTTVSAQRAILEKGEDKKIFVVPLVLGYHFVLEAKSLIEQHLRKEGEERYLKSHDESHKFLKIIRFVFQFFNKRSDILLSFGEPIDVAGNLVNDKGESLDQFGNAVPFEDFFKNSEGKVNFNKQRENVYTKQLSKAIVKSYVANNLVLSSQLLAYTAFEMLEKANPKLDLFELLRLPNDTFVVEKDVFHKKLQEKINHFKQLEQEGKIILTEEIHGSLEDIIKDGLSHLGIYHDKKPLKFLKKDNTYVSQDFKLLYYYYNKLVGYED